MLARTEYLLREGKALVVGVGKQVGCSRDREVIDFWPQCGKTILPGKMNKTFSDIFHIKLTT